MNEFENNALPLIYHRVGKRANNLGITALDVRANPEDPRQRAIFASVVNYSTNTQSASLELRFDDQLLEVKHVDLSPKETSPRVFIAAQPRDAGLFTVRLTAGDDLAADNQASVVSLLPQPIKVLLVTAGNRFLEKALRAAAHVELSVANGLADSAQRSTSWCWTT